MKIGIVALSFGKVRRDADDPINHTLSTFVIDAHEDVVSWRRALQGKPFKRPGGTEAVVVAQQEIARYLSGHPEIDLRIVDDTHATRKGSGRTYLDTQDVLNEAFRVFKDQEVRQVIVVAHPFLHARVARHLVKQAGYTNHEFRVNRHVDFDNSRNNLQWWCRGPIRFLAYLALQVAGKAMGKDFHGIGERRDSSV